MDHQFAVLSQALQGLSFENEVILFGQIALDERSLEDKEPAADQAFGKRLFRETSDPVALDGKFSKTVGWSDPGDRPDAAMRAMKGQERFQIDVTHPIAVGKAEGSIIFQIVGHPANTSAGLSGKTGLGQSHRPVILVVAAVKLDGFLPTEVHGDIPHPGFVVEEEVLDDVALVAQAQDEIIEAVAGVVLHDVPQYRAPPDLHHGLWLELGLLTQPGSLASTEDDSLHSTGLYFSRPLYLQVESRPSENGKMKNAGAALTATSMEALGRVAMLVLALVSARLLEPAQLGILALSVIVIGLVSILGAFPEVGAAIAEGVEGDHRRGRAGAIWRLLTCSLATLVVLAGLDPIAATLGGSPGQAKALGALIVSFLWLPWIETVSAYPRIVLRRKGDFAYLARLGFLSTAIFVIVAVALLIRDRNPAAVIAGQLLAATIASGLTWSRLRRLEPDRPGEWPTREEVMKVGRASFRLFLGGSGGYLSERLDNLLVAANLGSAQLPFYSVAWNLCRTPVALVSQAVANIVTAVAVERGDQNRLSQTLRNTHRFSHLLMSISAALAFFVGPLFIEPLLGTKWAQLEPMMRILAVGLLFVPVQLSATAFLISQGQAHLTGLTSAIHILAQITLIPPLCHRFGIVGAGYADVGNNVLVSALLCFAVVRSGGSLRWFELKTTIGVVLAAGFSGALAAFLATAMTSSRPLAALLALLLTFIFFPVFAAALGAFSILREASRVLRRWLVGDSPVAELSIGG